MKPLKTKVTLSIDEAIVSKLRILAKEDERTVSSCVNLILRKYIRNLDTSEGTEKIIIRNRPSQGETPSKTMLSVTLDGPMVEKLRTLAEIDDRQFSTYINMILRDYLYELEANKKDG